MRNYLLLIMLSIIGFNSYAATILPADTKRDPRAIKIVRGKDNKIYFRWCMDRKEIRNCGLIGSGGFTESELRTKIRKEKIAAVGEGGLVALGGVAAGVVVSSAVIITAPIGLITFLAAPAAVGGGISYKAIDLVGRSPLEHWKAGNYLGLMDSNVTVKVKDLDQVYDLYAEVIFEIEKNRKPDYLLNH